MMRKLLTLFTGTAILILSFFSITMKVNAETVYYENNEITLFAEEVMAANPEYTVVDKNDNEVTEIFRSWYLKEKKLTSEKMYDYLDQNDYALLYVKQNDSAKDSGIKSYGSKSGTKIFIDSFTAKINDVNRTVKFSTTITGNITYNYNTYEVISVYGMTISSSYSGTIYYNTHFFANGYSTSSYIPPDKTYGKITGNCSFYVEEYYGTPSVHTKFLKSVSHSFKIYSD